MTDAERLDRLTRAAKAAGAAFTELARVLAFDGPGPAYQLWKLGRHLEETAADHQASGREDA